MFRTNGFKPKTKTINVMLLDGGLGDHVASLVAVKYMAEQYRWIKPLVWVPDFLKPLTRLALPDRVFVGGFSDMRGIYDPTRPTKTTKWDGITSPMKIHCVDYAFLKLCDENPSAEHKNYLSLTANSALSKFNLPEKYVIVTTGYTAKVREFPAKEINTVVDFINLTGYTPVFLGQKNTTTGAAHIIQGKFDEQINFDKGINLVDKTTLLEALDIMHGAKAVIGVDNGLLHLAGCTDTTIIGGFTTVSPYTRMPYRYGLMGWNYKAVVPDQDLDCRFCQEKTNFLYGHKYTNCMYNDNLCTTQMTAQKFINHLSEILDA